MLFGCLQPSMLPSCISPAPRVRGSDSPVRGVEASQPGADVEGSPYPPSIDRLVAQGSKGSGATLTRPRRTSGWPKKGISMTARTRRMSPILIASRRDIPGAVPIAFSLTRKIAPCGIPIVRRQVLSRHRNPMASRELLMPEVKFLQSPASVTCCPSRGNGHEVVDSHGSGCNGAVRPGAERIAAWLISGIH